MLSTIVLVVLWIICIYIIIHRRNYINIMLKENRIGYEKVSSTQIIIAVIFTICVLIIISFIDNLYQDVFLSCFELFLVIIWCLGFVSTRYCIVNKESLELHELKIKTIEYKDIKSFAFFEHDVINFKVKTKVKELVVFTEEKMIPLLENPKNEKCIYESLVSQGIEHINSEKRLKLEVEKIINDSKYKQRLRTEEYRILRNTAYILPTFILSATFILSVYILVNYRAVEVTDLKEVKGTFLTLNNGEIVIEVNEFSEKFTINQDVKECFYDDIFIKKVQAGDPLILYVKPGDSKILKLNDASNEYISIECVNAVYSQQRAYLLILDIILFFVSILISLFTIFVAKRYKKGFYDNKLYDPFLYRLNSQKVRFVNNII